MKKKPEITGYFLEVGTLSSHPVAVQRGALKEMRIQIHRHIDNVAWASIKETRSDPRCEYCNARWTEDSDTYNGGCCPQDITAECGARLLLGSPGIPTKGES